MFRCPEADSRRIPGSIEAHSGNGRRSPAPAFATHGRRLAEAGRPTACARTSNALLARDRTIVQAVGGIRARHAIRDYFTHRA
jgi:hypothetical protein